MKKNHGKRKLMRGKKIGKRTLIVRGRSIHLRSLAKKYDMDPGYLSRILSGKRSVDRLTVLQAEKISSWFGCTIQELKDYIQSRVQSVA